MSKVKKSILIAVILVITCALTSVITIVLYDNFAPIPQKRLFMGLVGEENIEDVETVKFKSDVTYFYKDGTEINGDHKNENYTWDKWN